ncbi:MAG: hypothetical protein H3C47_11045 [Candidatus Cloacimonetes bacterium]|nr:hypothetical protein [Candidatus Cloacimonadota bacterium]
MPEVWRYLFLFYWIWALGLILHFPKSYEEVLAGSIPFFCAFIGASVCLGNRPFGERDLIRPIAILSGLASLIFSQQTLPWMRLFDVWIASCLGIGLYLLMRRQQISQPLRFSGTLVALALYGRFLIASCFPMSLEQLVSIPAHFLSLSLIPLLYLCQKRFLPALLLIGGLTFVIVPALTYNHTYWQWLFPALRIEVLNLLALYWLMQFHETNTGQAAMVCQMILASTLPLFLMTMDPIYTWISPCLALMVSLWFLCLKSRENPMDGGEFGSFIEDRFHTE